MNKLVLSLSLLTTFSLTAGESDTKKLMAQKEVDLSCGSCNKYVLTHATPLPDNYIFWEKIVRPSHYVMGDLSTLMPVSCLPTIYCNSCKNPCAEAAIYRRGSTLKAVYKIVNSKTK